MVVKYKAMVYNAMSCGKFHSMLRRRNSGAESPVGELTYMLNSKKITRYLTSGHHVHLVGIGGVSMRPLGLVLKGMGMESPVRI